MSRSAKAVTLPDGKTGIEWERLEKPCLNQWYRTMDNDLDYWKITKDYYSPERRERCIRLLNTITAIFFIRGILSNQFGRLCARTHIGR